MYYTGIGSRSCPIEDCEKLARIAQILASRGHVLRSGAAEGADSAFESGHLLINENMEIFIPWKSFVKELKPYHFFLSTTTLDKKASEIASKIHPAWKRCSAAAKKLHTRNVYQVLGKNLETPSDFLIAWTPDGKAVGGSATAINLAEQNKIPVFNTNSPELRKLSAMEFIQHISKNISNLI